MATRASIILKEQGQTVAAIYKHWDGYVQGGLGDQLVDQLISGKIVNGLGTKAKLGEVYNGAGCLFASTVATLKTEPGDVYLIPPDSAGLQGEDYVYTLDVDADNKPTLKVQDMDSGVWKVLFNQVEHNIYNSDQRR